MNTAPKAALKPSSLLAIVLVLSALAASALGADAEAGKLLPPDSLLLVSVPSFQALRENVKKTSYYALYKDPAMQAFAVPTEKTVRQLVDKALAEFWNEAGIEEPPKQMPLPQGRVVLGVLLRTVTRKYPVYDWRNRPPQGDPPIKEWRESKEPKPKVLLSADMGKDFEAAGRLIRQSVSAMADKGWRRQTEQVRGLEMVVLSPPPVTDKSGASPHQEVFCYALTGTTVIFATEQQLMKDCLARMGGAELASLADDANFQAAVKAVDPSADVICYLNAKALIQLARETADPEDLPEVERVIRSLGVEGINGLAASLSIAPNPTDDLRLQVTLSAPSPRTGIPALLSPATMSTKPARLLTRGLASFFVANYDLGKVYGQVLAIASQVVGMPIEAHVQAFMMMTGGQGPEGRPPVDLRREVFGQLAGPLAIVGRIDRPLSAPDASKSLLAVGVRDAAVLEAALARIHDTFLAQGRNELRREMLNRIIYLLPLGDILGLFLPFGPPSGQPDKNSLAFSVAGDQFVFAKVGMVEQAIRDLNRKDIESIAADPMYQYASKRLPAQAGAFGYSNAQLEAELFWTQLKDAAKRLGAQGGGLRGPEAFSHTPAKPMQAYEEDEADILSGNITRSVMDHVVRELSQYVDFNTLPDFQAVRKYFGPSVFHLVADEKGLHGEIVFLKAPQGD